MIVFVQTLFIGSSILTAISFLLFGIYCFLWLKQPEYEWMPPFCLVCIIYFSCMGLVSIPYILTIEIFPKEVCLKWFDILKWNIFDHIYIQLFIIGTFRFARLVLQWWCHLSGSLCSSWARFSHSCWMLLVFRFVWFFWESCAYWTPFSVFFSSQKHVESHTKKL